MATMTTPDWLAQRDGKLMPSKGSDAYAVYLSGQPLYLLMPLPAKGKFVCRISQTNNGRRLDGDAMFATAEDAVRGGLERLRETMGW